MQDYLDQAAKNGVVILPNGRCQCCGADYERGIAECIDTFNSIEHLRGSTHDDVLTGGAGANSIIGGAGNDTIFGTDGGDVLSGGANTDTLNYSGLGHGLTSGSVDAAGTGSIVHGGFTDSVSGFENFTLTGFADTLSINNNFLSSMGSLNAGGGTDHINLTGTGASSLTSLGIDGGTLAGLFSNVEQLDFTNTDLDGGDQFDIGDNHISAITGGTNTLDMYVTLSTISLSDINVLSQTGTVSNDTTVGNTRTVDWDNGTHLVIHGS